MQHIRPSNTHTTRVYLYVIELSIGLMAQVLDLPQLYKPRLRFADIGAKNGALTWVFLTLESNKSLPKRIQPRLQRFSFECFSDVLTAFS